jgi:chromosome segregation ATPase
LELQLKQAHDDLKSDEEIFADKEKELNQLKENVSELESKLSMANRCLEASLNKEKEQQDLMLQLQIQLDKLMSSKKPFEQKLDQAKINSDHHAVTRTAATAVLSNRGANVNNSQMMSAAAADSNAKQRAKTAPQSNSSMINPTNQVAHHQQVK